MSDGPSHWDEPVLPPPPPPIAPGSEPSWAGAAPEVPGTDAGQLRGLRALSLALMALLAVTGLLNMASVPNDLAYMSNVQQAIDGTPPDLAEIQDQEDTRGAFAALTLVALLLSAVAWVLWQQRARRCARGLGAGGQRHSETVAALSWIIPFANLVLPKHVTNDLWRASDPEAPPVHNIDGKPVWAVIDLWWALWIVGGVIGRFLITADEPDTFDELDSYLSSLRLELGATLITVASGVLAILIVQRITTRLLERAQRRGIAV